MNNGMQIISQIMRSGGNPQTIAMNMLQSQAQNNPMLGNVLQMAQGGNSKGVETVARNLCKERGVDPDQMINQIRNQFYKR